MAPGSSFLRRFTSFSHSLARTPVQGKQLRGSLPQPQIPAWVASLYTQFLPLIPQPCHPVLIYIVFPSLLLAKMWPDHAVFIYSTEYSLYSTTLDPAPSPPPPDLMEESWTKPDHSAFMVGLRAWICVGDS